MGLTEAKSGLLIGGFRGIFNRAINRQWLTALGG